MAVKDSASGADGPLEGADPGGRADGGDNVTEPVTLSEALTGKTPDARVLLVVPSPINDATRLPFETELREIYGALDHLRVDVDVVRLDPPTVDTLRVALASNAFDVVHIATHCTADALEFENEDGTAAHVSYRELAETFSSHRECVLVLNGCSTEAIADTIANEIKSVTTIAVAGSIARADAARVLRSIYELLFTGSSPRQLATYASNKLRRQRVGFGGGRPVVTARGPRGDQAVMSLSTGHGHPKYHRCFPPTNLPPGGRAFFDRENETLELHQLLCVADADRPVIGVTGITGTGKTALVQAAARRYGWRFPGGVGYFSLRNDFSIELLAEVFGWGGRHRQIGMSVGTATRELSKGRYLLIFDDIGDAPRPTLGEVIVLSTGWDAALGGRTILVAQERTPELLGLVGRRWVTVDQLPPKSAGDLLLHCLPGGDAVLERTGADVHEVTNLCLGHPKTIESAASLLSLGQSWSVLREDLLKFAGQGPLSVNEEMLGQIVSQLELRQPAVRDFLDAWSVFDERCRQDAWRRVTAGGSEDEAARAAHNSALNELQGANLIDRYDVDGETRCVMHPLVSRHLLPRHQRLSAEKLGRFVRTQIAEQTTLARISTASSYALDEARNIRRTLAWAADLGLWEPAMRYCQLVVGNEHTELARRGPWRLARELLRWGAEAAEHLGDVRSRTEFVVVRGTVDYRLADFDHAAAAYEEAAELASQINELRIRVRALRGCGQVRYRLGDYDTALAYFTEVRELAGELGEEAVAAIDHQVGKILYRQHKLGDARSVLAQVRAVRMSVGSRRDLAKTIHELARVEHADGCSEAAYDLYHEALKIEQQIEDPVMEQATQFQLGVLALEQADLAEARMRFRDSRQISERLNDQVWLVHAAWAEARLAHAEGAHDAESKAKAALSAARSLQIGLARQIEHWLQATVFESQNSEGK